MFEKICDDFEDKTDWIINIGKLKNDYQKKYKAKYYIGIWFNDMFGWAYSHAMTFTMQNNTIDELMKKFNEWYDSEGIKFKEKFDVVPYPSHDKEKGYNWPEVEKYFKSNSLIALDLEDSINKFCGHKLNDDFDRKKLKEE